MPKPKSQGMKETRRRYLEAGLKKLEIWVKNNPKSIAEAKALDMKHTVKKGDKDGSKT